MVRTCGWLVILALAGVAAKPADAQNAFTANRANRGKDAAQFVQAVRHRVHPQGGVPRRERAGLRAGATLALQVKEVENTVIDKLKQVQAKTANAFGIATYIEQLDKLSGKIRGKGGVDLKAAVEWLATYGSMIDSYVADLRFVEQAGPEQLIGRLVQAYEILIADLSEKFAERARFTKSEATRLAESKRRIVRALSLRVEKLRSLSFSDEMRRLEEQLALLNDLREWVRQLHDGLLALMATDDAVQTLGSLKVNLLQTVKQFEAFSRKVVAAEGIVLGEETDTRRQAKADDVQKVR